MSVKPGNVVINSTEKSKLATPVKAAPSQELKKVPEKEKSQKKEGKGQSKLSNFFIKRRDIKAESKLPDLNKAEFEGYEKWSS